jgi:hypothetical protein
MQMRGMLSTNKQPDHHIRRFRCWLCKDTIEPLSAGASIITVLGAAAATKEGIQRLRSLRHAQGQLDPLNNEVGGPIPLRYDPVHVR